MRQPVRTPGAWPMVGDKNRVGPDCAYDHRSQCHFIAARSDRYPVVIVDAMILRKLRMYLCTWFGILIDQRANSSGLGSGEVLADDTSCREIDGIFIIHWIS